jgi:hypothetical protein
MLLDCLGIKHHLDNCKAALGERVNGISCTHSSEMPLGHPKSVAISVNNDNSCYSFVVYLRLYAVKQCSPLIIVSMTAELAMLLTCASAHLHCE